MEQLGVALLPVGAVVERGLERALVEADGGWFEAGVGSGAGPGPVERVADEAGLRTRAAGSGLFSYASSGKPITRALP